MSVDEFGIARRTVDRLGNAAHAGLKPAHAGEYDAFVSVSFGAGVLQDEGGLYTG